MLALRSLFRLLCALCLLLIQAGPALAEQLRFGYDEYPPLSYTMDGEATGQSIELVREASRRLGIEPVFVHQPFIRLLDSIREGQIDGMVDLYETPERKKFLYFSSWSATSEHIHVYVRKELAGRISSLDDAKTFAVGAVRGYHYGERIDEELKSRLNLVKDCRILYGMLLEGRFDAAVGNSMAARFYMGPQLDSGAVLPVLELARLDYHVVFSKTLGPRGQMLADLYAREIAWILRERNEGGGSR